MDTNNIMGSYAFTVDDLIVVVAAIGAAVSVFMAWSALLVRDDLGPRLKSLAKRRDSLRSQMIGAANNRHRNKSASHGWMKDIVERLKLLRSAEANKASLSLAAAGIRSPDAVVTYLFMRLALPFVLGPVAWLYIYALDLMEAPWPMIIGACGALLGAAAPGLYIKNLADKRRKACKKGLPDALDLMVICAECGLSLDTTLDRVSRELGPSAPELADELGLTSVELTFLPERRKALDNLAERTNLDAIRGVVNTLKQTERYGTPLAQSLRVLAAEFRNDRLMKAEEKAARLPAILTVPMMLFILPVLFIVLMGPAILSSIDVMNGKY
jgi:tight adherence protein C